jgi:predicted Zn-dependent protease
MLTQARAAEIFDRLRRLTAADEIEVLFSAGKLALTRFANNTIHQNVAEEGVTVSVRTAFGGRTARATTNKLDLESLKRVVAASESLARVQQPDPDLLPMPDARTAGSRGEVSRSRHFAQTAALSPEDRAHAVEQIVGVATRHRLTAAGIVSSAENVEGLFNSHGHSAWHTQTLAEVSITMLAADSSGWQKRNSPDAADLNALEMAEIAARKAVDSASPREVPPGKYTVVLEPSAVLDIAGFMFADFSGQALLDQRSFLNQRIGTKLFGENISITDDVAHPLQSGAPFDGEGVRRQPIPLVEKGVVRQLAYARATAEKASKSELAASLGPVHATGHGFPLPNEIGEMPVNIVFAAPADPRTVEQMIAATERGILVTRLWYIREVEPYEKILTGMTRDGTFLIENGRVRYGIRNFRFNESLVHMLSNVTAMGQPVRASGEESFDMVVPAMQVRNFNFTEVTKF